MSLRVCLLVLGLALSPGAIGCSALAERRHANHGLAATRAAACQLALHFSVIDLVPAGRDGVSLRITHPSPGEVQRKLRSLWPKGPPPGVSDVSVERARPRLVVVLDDFGLHGAQLETVWGLGEPFSYAILPRQRYSARYARWLAARGASILAHVPMEPEDTRHMTLAGFLRVGMSDAERVRMFREHLETVPGAVGWNNHMGSRLTALAPAMRALVAASEAHHLVLDSRTSARTTLEAAAREAGRPALRRHLFLDNVRDVSHIRTQLAAALRLATRRGAAVAIGHPYPETIRALKLFVAEHRDEVQLVPIERAVPAQVAPVWRRHCKPGLGLHSTDDPR